MWTRPSETNPNAPATRFALARALWDAGRDRDRARSLAAQARAGYATLGLKGKTQLAEIDAWSAARQ
jgi:hypothetical protein